MNILIDSNEYNEDVFGLSFEFFIKKGLITYKSPTRYKVEFVGEVTTSFGYFISLPKNFHTLSPTSVQLVKTILKEYKNVRKNNELLITNKSFDSGHEIDSSFIYWKKLYAYFVDYITYGFFYPKKRLIRHSLKRENGVINTLMTELNRSRIGSGITYEVKDHKKNMLSDVYYSTLKDLESQFASDHESLKIKEMEAFLRGKGFEFDHIKVDTDAFLSKAKTMDVSAIHETILTTLVNYYSHSKFNEKNKINVFYTLQFEYLCEYLIQKALKHHVDNKTKYWLDPNYKSLRPDIITADFIGDVKYYRLADLSKASFDKELYAHNIAHGNVKPNFVFIPSETTQFLEKRTHDVYQLKIVSLNLQEVMEDCFTGETTVLDKISNM